jgi:two-component system CheB/CheR fusion protein
VASWLREGEPAAGGKRLVVAISDTGVGIEPEVLPRIFSAFEQGPSGDVRGLGGLGLGLAISKAILELHGGSLAAASQGRDRGATFTVEVPAGLFAAPSGPDPAETSAPKSKIENPKFLRLLLVEDHADTAEAMACLLEAKGYVVRVAGSLAAAHQAIEADPGFDLVISDLGLPDGTGIDLMSELSRGYGLPGIALSGYGMEDDVRRSREAGFKAHLTKPVSLEALEEAIRATLGSP